MKLNLELVFHTDGDFWFNNEDKLFDKDSLLFKLEDCKYTKLFDIDNEEVSFHLSVKGTARDCRYAVRELIGNLVCNIRTHDYYMVFKISVFLINAIERLNGLDDDSGDFYYHNSLSGNYEGTFIIISADMEDT